MVPSSREAVDADSAWNQALRSELPGLFMEALQRFSQLHQLLPQEASEQEQDQQPEQQEGMAEDGSEEAQQAGAGAGGASSELALVVKWVDRWLRCLPLEGQVQGFFAPLVAGIAARARASACIPTEGGGWRLPGDVVVCGAPALRSLLECDAAREALGAGFAHPGLEVRGAGGGADADANGRAGDIGMQRLDVLQCVAWSASPATATAVPHLHHMHTHSLSMQHHPAAPPPQVLHSSPGLRQLLGVREFSTQQLLELLRALQARSRLAELGVAWLQRTLLAVFSLLGVAGADMGMASMPAAGGLSRTQVRGLDQLAAGLTPLRVPAHSYHVAELYKMHSRRHVCSACLPHLVMQLMC